MRMLCIGVVTLGAAVLATVPAGAADLGRPSPGRCPSSPRQLVERRRQRARRSTRLGAAFIALHRHGGAPLHPDFGGDARRAAPTIYGMPYVVVDGTQAKSPVDFEYSDESDGVTTRRAELSRSTRSPTRRSRSRTGSRAASRATWTSAATSDRHMLIVDRDNKYLYELYTSATHGDAVAGGLGRVLRHEHERPAARGLDVGRRRGAGDPARARALRRGVRTRGPRSATRSA